MIRYQMPEGRTLDVLLQTTRCIVVCGDVLDAIATFGRVNHSITDPPYTEHVHVNIRSVDCRGKVKVKKWTPGFKPLEGFKAWHAQLSNTQAWSLNFCALEQLGDYERASGGFRTKGGCYVRSWIWRKGQAAPQLSGNCPANSCEGVAVAHNPNAPMIWNGRGKHAWWDGDVEELQNEQATDNVVFSNRDKSEKRHPNQKPDKLCEDLILKFTRPNDLIGDWFCGSGAIAAAALKHGRNVIACDFDPKWAAFTALRCSRILRGDFSHEPKGMG